MLAKTARDVGHLIGTAAGRVTRDILKHQEDVNRRALTPFTDPIHGSALTRIPSIGA